MFSTVRTPSGVIAPLKLNQFEFQRRYHAWKKEDNKRVAKQKLNDTDTRRALYNLRNYGVDAVLRMDAEARELRRSREQAAAERIADEMCKNAVAAVKKELNLARGE